MANRFHINEAKGEIGACRADKGNCPFGGSENHYDSMVEAASAYEQSMESQVFSTVKKPRKVYGADLGLTLTPSADFKGDLDLSASERAEVQALTPEQAEIYEIVRKEVGPAMTHMDAHNLVEALRLTVRDTGSPSYESLRAEAATGNPIHDSLAQKLTDSSGGYGHYKSAAELNDGLVARMTNIVSTSRPYGFPEDEYTRYRMDHQEMGLLHGASRLSGVDSREIRARILDQATVDRPFKDESDASLQKRQSHLSQLSRMTNAKRVELKRINKEVAIRDVTAGANSPEEAYEIATRYIDDRTLTAREVSGLIGTAREETIAKLSGRTKRIWEDIWNG